MSQKLYNDYQEISVWDTKYIEKYQKPIKKKFYKYLFGTQIDFHLYCKNISKLLLLFFTLFRGSGCFYGINNIIMGICHFGVLFHISYILVIFSIINVIFTILICYYSNINMELVYNGLYPANTTFSTLFLYFFQISIDHSISWLFKMIFVLFILDLFVILLFKKLSVFFIKKN